MWTTRGRRLSIRLMGQGLLDESWHENSAASSSVEALVAREVRFLTCRGPLRSRSPKEQSPGCLSRKIQPSMPHSTDIASEPKRVQRKRLCKSSLNQVFGTRV